MPTRPLPASETLAIHAGESEREPGEPVTPSIVVANSFHAAPDSGFSATMLDADAPPFYTRWGNPTLALLERRLAVLEAGVGAIAFASGMAAISALFLSRLRSGDHLVVPEICYPGVAELAALVLPRMGIAVSVVDTSDVAAVARAIRPGTTRLVHIETPSNLILRLSDIAALADLAHRAGAELSVDSTIATPIATQPLTLGADYVVHSLTKYMCGHGDAMGGAVVGRDARQLLDMRRHALAHQGAVLSPFAAWLMLRGIETLPLRMRAHEANARAISAFLQQHPLVTGVFWPGLDTHSQAALSRRQMRCFSGLLSFTMRGDGRELMQRIAGRIRVFSHAVSLGKTKSLIYYVPTDSLLAESLPLDASAGAAYRSIAGEGIFRVSAGLENPADLIADLDHALA